MAIATINDTLQPAIKTKDQNGRGLQIYTATQLRAITGRTETGERITGTYDQSVFYLTLEERLNIFRLCSPVFSVVTSRMNTVSGMEFDVISDKKNEDRIHEQLKNYYDFVNETKSINDPKYIIARAKIIQQIKETLPDCLPDLSNFSKALLRWKRRIQGQKTDKGDEIKEWILQPNLNDRYEEYIKKTIFDLMVHGSLSVYKEKMGGIIENFYLLPGGTVIPLRNKYIGGPTAYVQITSTADEPLIYFQDELSYANYCPTSARAYGYIPLEALINKITETLFFDRLMAEQADGTRPPEKVIIIANNSPFGDMNKEINVPVNEDEQKRIEDKVNEPIKNRVMTFTGNVVQVVDLSRENTMPIQMQREKDIREEVGMVFQATALEMNLAGSENLSGRSTADAQREVYNSRAVKPMIKIIKMIFDRDIIPFRYGPGWKVDYDKGKTEVETLDILQRKVNLDLYSTNELRVDELNEDPFPDEQYDRPTGGNSQSPDGSQQNPFNFQGM